MKCNYLNTNKYEIVGLCPIEKFTEEIGSLEDKAWSQITISNNSIALNDGQNIKTISKIFVDVKITSTKLLDTPKSTKNNVEGLNLTGKSLLVTGEVNQKILYRSHPNNMNSIKVNSPFTAHIVVEENTNISEDKFCVYPYVEHLSVQPIDECTLSQNIILFLFAHKTWPPKPPKPYPNQINFDDLAEIEFDTAKNTLQVISTGNIAPGNLRETYLKVMLLDSTGIDKQEGEIMSGRDGEDFKLALNNAPYSFGDILHILSRNPNSTEITNFPNQGETYRASASLERFRITETGLLKIGKEYPNDIIFRNDAGQELAKIRFTLTRKTLFVTTTNNTEQSTSRPILQFILYAPDGTTIKERGVILGRRNAQEFVNSLNGRPFDYGDILSIQYGQSPQRVEIINYPEDGDDYNPIDPNGESFRIEIERLSKIT